MWTLWGGYILLSILALSAEIVSPQVDISFLVADIKYSEERGVQICEIQHGTDSVFKGEAFVNEGVSHIAANFANFFSSYHQRKWIIPWGVCDAQLVKALSDSYWKPKGSHKKLMKDKNFQKLCAQPLGNPDQISSYHGFVIADSSSIGKLDQQLCCNSVILIDRAMLPFWRDKYKVSLLFKEDSVLESFKPKWKLYPAVYDHQLAEQVIGDLEASRFVIKPRGMGKGKGVIIVDEAELDDTLNYILHKSKELRDDPDRAYNSWYEESGDSFIVEEFIPSDPVLVPHLGMQPYCPTLRIVFLAIYENGIADIHFLGGYNCLPEKSLVEKGSLHQKYKVSLETVNSSKIEQRIYNEVIEILYEPLRLFYQRVLGDR